MPQQYLTFIFFYVMLDAHSTACNKNALAFYLIGQMKVQFKCIGTDTQALIIYDDILLQIGILVA